jgi:NhaA family Na+:H+ antiporter
MTVFLGVLFGLVFGKPFGIVFAGWLGHTLRIAQKPKSIKWSQLISVGFIAGIGFTISILIADLAYAQSVALQNAAVLGIFCASISMGVIGSLALYTCTRRVQA